MKKLKPILDNEYWIIGKNPDLEALENQIPASYRNNLPQECVDHHIFQTDDSIWHLWGCIRNTAVGRILYHWESDSLEKENWKQTGQYLRIDNTCGESLHDTGYEKIGEYLDETIQSPFVVHFNNVYYMFFGGGSTRTDKNNNSVSNEDQRITWQICLMLSEDGKKWSRYKNKDGMSRLFKGPGFSRDPCLLKTSFEGEDLWLMFYAGYMDGEKYKPGFFVRTSRDLLNWSESMLVHYDISGRFGSGFWSCECPHVVKRSGYYYLFRTEHYSKGKTHIFRSKNPFDFGIGDAKEKYVCSLFCAAPEIILDKKNNQEYISSNHYLDEGTSLCRLKWIPD